MLAKQSLLQGYIVRALLESHGRATVQECQGTVQDTDAWHASLGLLVADPGECNYFASNLLQSSSTTCDLISCACRGSAAFIC